MKFNELVTEFCRANEEGRAVEGYIVFAPQSFELPYPLQSRTYLVSSDNKRFKKGMSGNSIFGSALDGSDNGVRLDLYMEDAGVENGWVVEDCGLVSYQLLETCDRSTMVKGIYSTKTEAHNAMQDEICVALMYSDEDINQRMEEETGEISDFGAWANDVMPNHSDYDWDIIRLFNNGRSIRSEADMNENKNAFPKVIRGRREFTAEDIVFDDDMLMEENGLVSFYLCVPEKPEEILGKAVQLEEGNGSINLMAFFNGENDHVADTLTVTVIKDMADGSSEETYLYKFSTKEKELFEAAMRAYSYNGYTLKDILNDEENDSMSVDEQRSITVREIAKKNPGVLLDMMTPYGYLTIMADELLQAKEVNTNPGTAGCDMCVEASDILDMKAVSFFTVDAAETPSGKTEIRMITDN